MGKKSVTITIDEHLWLLAKDKLPCSRSEFFENQLRLFLDIDDPETKIVEKINKKENEINVLKDKLCNIRREKQLKLQSEEVFSNCMVAINRINNSLGKVGKNQIRNIAHQNNVPYLDLENYVKDLGYELVNFLEVPKW